MPAVTVEVRDQGFSKAPTPESRGQYLLGSGSLTGWRMSPPSHSGWCSRCRWGSRWQMVVTVTTGMASCAGLCTGPQRSLQDNGHRQAEESGRPSRRGLDVNPVPAPRKPRPLLCDELTYWPGTGLEAWDAISQAAPEPGQGWELSPVPEFGPAVCGLCP